MFQVEASDGAPPARVQFADELTTSSGEAPRAPELARSIAEKLRSRTYDCSVCTDMIGFGDPLWACQLCYGVFHLPCIAYWASSQAQQQSAAGPSQAGSSGGSTFRCPLCQGRNPTASTTQWRCFCGRLTEPRVEVDLVPGACGATCGKLRGPLCPHRCPDLCHPGPCAPCPLMREIACSCGAEVTQVPCGSSQETFTCTNVCGKTLSCGKHACEFRCHLGACSECPRTMTASCHCGAITDTNRQCSALTGFSCHRRCHRSKSCGRHQCDLECHTGDCNPCERDPSRQQTCACGKMPLWRLHHKDKSLPSRAVCTDAIPSCGAVCGRPLPCGHTCPQTCHDSPCAPCLVVSNSYCRCHGSKRPMVCFASYVPQERWATVAEEHSVAAKVIPKSWPMTCDKHCRKALNCGRHKCETVCCGGADDDHVCLQICQRKAPCGIHTCGQLCHKGPCPRCHNTSFEPLYCRCRRSVLEPPVPCGTPPPICNHPCVVPRECGHPPGHACHPEGIPCPDCVVLVESRCASHNVAMPYFRPCSYPVASCGKNCNKKLECCGVKCNKVCHTGPCAHAFTCPVQSLPA